eukprot:1356592-Amorphochlora_amoeboformis.AAC.1
MQHNPAQHNPQVNSKKVSEMSPLEIRGELEKAATDAQRRGHGFMNLKVIKNNSTDETKVSIMHPAEIGVSPEVSNDGSGIIVKAVYDLGHVDPGDVIIGVNGKDVRSMSQRELDHELRKASKEAKYDNVQIKVIKGGLADGRPVNILHPIELKIDCTSKQDGSNLRVSRIRNDTRIEPNDVIVSGNGRDLRDLQDNKAVNDALAQAFIT